MLKIILAVVSDAANISREGKLNITGIFHNIKTSRFPASHPSMVLVYIIESDRGDNQQTHTLKIDLIDEDGSLLIPSLQGKINFKAAETVKQIRAPQIIQLSNVQFKKPGTHEFKIILNGEIMGTVPLDIIQIEKKK